MNGKRHRTVFYIYLFITLVLLTRVFCYQIIKGPKLSKAASSQRTKNYQVLWDRGDILDRNGIRFTNRSTESVIVINPRYDFSRKEEFDYVCEVLNINPDDVIELPVKGWEPVIIETSRANGDMIAATGLEGISVIHKLRRYDEDSIAVHVLGYLNAVDHTGDAGIEKFFNDVLENGNKSIVAAITDARNNIIGGTGYRIIGLEPENRELHVKLTLDYHIQHIVEKVMEENKITGAIVVEDVNNGDIVAMASKNDFNQNVISRYIGSPNNELFNRAVASYNLGSVFKIIDVAAALENGVDIPEKYYCKGYIEIGDRDFKCAAYDRGGHGMVDLTSAFANSCNTYFVNLGIKIGYKELLGTASAMGFGKPVGLMEQGVDESSGYLPGMGRYHSYGDVANISIGQGEIMATPVQVADITATIANGGIKNRVNVVDSIVEENGSIVRNLRVNNGKRVIKKETADTIKKIMEKVVEWGTGSQVNLELYGGAAGKTGSAETGQFINGENVVHAWFAGYFPRKYPRYSIAVFVENGKNGSRVAAPLFQQIAEEVLKKGY